MLLEARRSAVNERALRAAGAVEPADDVYGVMRLAYPACFLAMAFEAWVHGMGFGGTTLAGVFIFSCAKALKYWVVATLGGRLDVPRARSTRVRADAPRSLSPSPASQLRRGSRRAGGLRDDRPRTNRRRARGRGLRCGPRGAHSRRGARARFAITIESCPVQDYERSHQRDGHSMGASEPRERATRAERAGVAARESACRGVRGAKPLGQV